MMRKMILQPLPIALMVHAFALHIHAQTMSPSSGPSAGPSSRPTDFPSLIPSGKPSLSPTSSPSDFPTTFPTLLPTLRPSFAPSVSLDPTEIPSGRPSQEPTSKPSDQPSYQPTLSAQPSLQPSSKPSFTPSTSPSFSPSISTMPSTNPTISMMPSSEPSEVPSSEPSVSMAPSEQPSKSPTRSPVLPPSRPPNGDDDDTPVGLIVITMLAAVGFTICFGCNGRKTIPDFESAEHAAEEFYKEIRENNRLIVTIPCCGCTCKKRRFALFFSSRIKAKWLPCHTYMQMVLGWISLATTVIALFLPENKTNSVVGFASLFMNELLTNTWYGYIRYLLQGCGDDDDDSVGGDQNFDDMKYLFSVLYHGHGELIDTRYLDFIAFPFYAVMYIGTLVGFLITAIPLFILKACANDTNDGDDAIAAISAFVGVAVGCFTYPLMFLLFDTTAGKIVASFLHHGMSEYYEAKLFHKTVREFLWSVVFKALGDFTGVDDLLDSDIFYEAVANQGGLDFEAVKDEEEQPPSPGDN